MANQRKNSNKRNAKRRNQNSNKTRDQRFNGDRKDSVGHAPSSINDIAWYAKYPDILAAAARIPFPNKPGMTVKLGTNTVTVTGDTYSKEIPGVMGLYYSPSVGYSNDLQSPATIMSKEMWARIRSKFSASLDADPPDILMYLMALDQIHAYLAHIKRVWRTLALWSPHNRDFPDLMLNAMGIQPQMITYLQNNSEEFFGRLNLTIRKANKFLAPYDMDLFTRHRWMNEHVYMDVDSPMAQSYVFVPYTYWVVDSTAATKLVAKMVYNLPLGGISLLDVLFKPVDDMIDALSNWDDAYTINGYIERAWEGAQFYATDLMQRDEVLVPQYIPEVLTQIENCHPCEISTLSNLDVTQNPTFNTIIHTPKGVVDDSFNPVINLPIDNPTAADVTIATRLYAKAYPADGGRIYAGTEIVQFACMFKYEYTLNSYIVKTDGTGQFNLYYAIDTYFNDNPVTVAAMLTYVQHIMDYRDWSHAPMQVIGLKASAGATTKKYCISSDLHNMTSLTPEALEDIHKVCVYSEFNCFR